MFVCLSQRILLTPQQGSFFISLLPASPLVSRGFSPRGNKKKNLAKYVKGPRKSFPKKKTKEIPYKKKKMGGGFFVSGGVWVVPPPKKIA